MTFDGLYLSLQYRLTETKAPDGLQLLTEAAFQGGITRRIRETPKEDRSVWYTRPDGSGLELNIQGDCRYLGLWINQNGFHDCCCVGLEPSTQPQDIPDTNYGSNDGGEWVLPIGSYNESEAVSRQ